MLPLLSTKTIYPSPAATSIILAPGISILTGTSFVCVSPVPNLPLVLAPQV